MRLSGENVKGSHEECREIGQVEMIVKGKRRPGRRARGVALRGRGEARSHHSFVVRK